MQQCGKCLYFDECKRSLKVKKGTKRCKAKTRKFNPTNIIRIASEKLLIRQLKEFGQYTLDERAIPDYRDGLKPVQRRILTAMWQLKILWSSNFRKAAKIIGTTTGDYHPHGDAPVFQAMVNMAQAGKNPTRYPYIEGQGNWGTVTDNAGAPRYIEGRINKACKPMFDCMKVVPQVANYDGTNTEPLIFSPRLPYLMLNGNFGIAMGTTTSIPSHNIKEIINALNEILVNKTTDEDTILKHIKAPDYNGGCVLSSRKDIVDMYKNGKGSVAYTCLYKMETGSDYKALIINSYAPSFSVDGFIHRVKKLVDEDGLNFIVTDETSQKAGTRLVVEYDNLFDLKEYIVPMLNTTVSYNFNVSERRESGNNIFAHVTMVEFLNKWLDFRREDESELLEIEKAEIELRKHKEEARLAVIDNLKKFFTILQKSKNLEDDVKKEFKFDDVQTEYVLSSQTRTLSNLNRQDQIDLIADLKTKVKDKEDKLANIDKWISELLNQTQNLWDERRTALRKKNGDLGKAEKVFALTNKKGLMERQIGEKFKQRRWNWDWALEVKAEDGVVSVDKHGWVDYWEPTDIEDVDTGYQLVSMFPNENVELVVTLSKNGNYSVVENNDNPHYAFKLDQGDSITFAGGMKPGDVLWVWDEDASFCDVYKFEDMEKRVKRANTKARLLYKDDTWVLKGAVIGKDDLVIDHNGKKIGRKQVMAGKKYFIVGDNNIVRYKTGEIKLMDKKSVTEAYNNRMKFSHIYKI